MDQKQPLVLGLVDRLEAAGIKTFGPTAAAAALEGSKGFMKDLCAKYGIPTAAYGRFTDAEAARDFVRQRGAPIVVKVDGLAAGKGVTIARTVEEALAAVDEAMVDARFGAAGTELVIEEFLDGRGSQFLRPGATARRPFRWFPRRTTSASSTATPVPIPAAWGPIRRRPS